MKLIRVLVCALLLTMATATAGSATGGIRHDEESGSGAVPAPTPEQAIAVGYADTVAPHGFFWQLFTPQQVVPGAYLYALPTAASKGKTKGTRSDQQFFEISSTGSNDVPEAALHAYKHAASEMAKTDPSCQISWTLLAAIGRVESNHGRFGGSELGSDGVSRPAIVGPRLDGAGPFAAIHDSDGGALDGDKKWDRAIGQMQFLPSTWHSVARDGDGDGVKNPGDIDDSALGSAVYLCGAGNLSTDAGMARAAFRYNQSDYYVALVLSFAHGFQTGVFTLPSPPPPPGQKNKQPKVQQVADAVTAKPKKTVTKTITKPKVTTTVAPKAPTPTKSSSPRPTPTPTPTPTPFVGDFTGVLRADGQGYTLDGVTLSFGGTLADPAPDFDNNPETTTLRQELDAMLALPDPVTLKVHGSKLDGVITVDEVKGTL